MTIAMVLLELLEQIKDDQFTDEVKATLKKQIDSAAVDRTSDPRDRTEGNQNLLNAAMLVVYGTVQDLYGVGDETDLYPFPIFEAQPQSQIVPLIKDRGTVTIVLGENVRSWEDVFYDICHESLHLLNPAINVKICALEEGVAVKFAEQMYEKCVIPYCDKMPRTSPANSYASEYYVAYSAAKKIPDDVLKEIRNVFGKFSKIDDAEKFGELVSEYLNDDEIERLVAPFITNRKEN